MVRQLSEDNWDAFYNDEFLSKEDYIYDADDKEKYNEISNKIKNNLFSKPILNDESINHPKHYTQGSMETIDIIFNVIEPIENPNVAMCIGNSIKYLSRFTHKGNPIEDLKKAIWYINKVIEEMEK